MGMCVWHSQKCAKQQSLNANVLVVNTQHAKIKCFNLGSHATIILYCNIVEILKTKTYFHFISFIWH